MMIERMTACSSFLVEGRRRGMKEGMPNVARKRERERDDRHVFVCGIKNDDSCSFLGFMPASEGERERWQGHQQTDKNEKLAGRKEKNKWEAGKTVYHLLSH